MSRPDAGAWKALKKLCRYVKGQPTVKQVVPFGSENGRVLEVFVDADWAGFATTRKSTNGGAVMWNGTCLKTWSTTQTMIALSSGEAEYYGLVSGVSQVFGMISMAKDWGILLKGHVWMDATAGMAIGSRRGLGKVKHIDTAFLWVQDAVSKGKVTLGKKDTKDMLADILTKPSEWKVIEKMNSGMGYRFQGGKHELGLRA